MGRATGGQEGDEAGSVTLPDVKTAGQRGVTRDRREMDLVWSVWGVVGEVVAPSAQRKKATWIPSRRIPDGIGSTLTPFRNMLGVEDPSLAAPRHCAAVRVAGEEQDLDGAPLGR